MDYEQGLVERLLDDVQSAPSALPLLQVTLDPAADGFTLHVLGPEDDLALAARLAERAAAAALPVRKIVLHRDLADVPRPEFIRALLHETVVTREEATGTWTLR